MVSATEDGLGKLSRQKLLDIFKGSGENYHVFSNYRGMEHFNINGQQEQHLVRVETIFVIPPWGYKLLKIFPNLSLDQLPALYYIIQCVTSF